MTIPEINEEIKKFLNNTEGRAYFRKITQDYTAANRSELKKRILNPSEKALKRKRVEALLSNKINEINIKKKLDN